MSTSSETHGSSEEWNEVESSPVPFHVKSRKRHLEERIYNLVEIPVSPMHDTDSGGISEVIPMMARPVGFQSFDGVPSPSVLPFKSTPRSLVVDFPDSATAATPLENTEDAKQDSILETQEGHFTIEYDLIYDETSSTNRPPGKSKSKFKHFQLFKWGDISHGSEMSNDVQESPTEWQTPTIITKISSDQDLKKSTTFSPNVKFNDDDPSDHCDDHAERKEVLYDDFRFNPWGLYERTAKWRCRPTTSFAYPSSSFSAVFHELDVDSRRSDGNLSAFGRKKDQFKRMTSLVWSETQAANDISARQAWIVLVKINVRIAVLLKAMEMMCAIILGIQYNILSLVGLSVQLIGGIIAGTLVLWRFSGQFSLAAETVSKSLRNRILRRDHYSLFGISITQIVTSVTLVSVSIAGVFKPTAAGVKKQDFVLSAYLTFGFSLVGFAARVILAGWKHVLGLKIKSPTIITIDLVLGWLICVNSLNVSIASFVCIHIKGNMTKSKKILEYGNYISCGIGVLTLIAGIYSLHKAMAARNKKSEGLN